MPTLKKFRGIGIDLLWPLVILVGLGFYTALVPLPPNDFWWHLKIGELIYNGGGIPDTNLFGWTLAADYPFVYGAWLGEFLYYCFYRWGGLALVMLVRTTMALAAWGLVGYEARRRSGSWRWATLAMVLAGLMSFNNLIVRPQNWSWLPFMIYLILLGRYADGQLRKRWLLVLPLIMVFWVNAHGAFILGGVLIGIFVVGEGGRTFFKQVGALCWRDVGLLAGTGVLTVGAILINPRFLNIVAYVIDLLTDQPSQNLVVEWQSPAPVGLANIAFFGSILLLMVTFGYTRVRPRFSEWLLVISFLWLAWSGQRYVVWFGMVTMPVLVQALAGMLPAHFRQPEARPTWVNVLLAVLLFVPLGSVLLGDVERLPLPAGYWKQVWRNVPAGPLLTVETPVKATEYLREHPGGRLFNEMGYGSYLIWALPEQGVFVDPRVELYPFEQWEDYMRISQASRYNELLAHYGADRLMLDRQLQAELVTALESDPLWQKEYEDFQTQIWYRVVP